MFNALNASAQRAPHAFSAITASRFTPLDPDKQPTRKDVLQIRRVALAVSKEISTDGTPHGYTGLVVDGAEYDRITNNAPPYQIPVHPGRDAPQGANQLAAYHNEEHHKRVLKEYVNYSDAHTYIRNAMITAIPERFILALCDPDCQYANVTVLALLNHMFTTYGTVTREDLDQNEEELKAPWTPSTPIEALWLQATRAQQFPPDTDALSNNYILRALASNIRNTKAFDSTLKRFDELPVADQTLARFKTEMNKSYKTWVRSQTNTTAEEAGYSSANVAHTPAPPAVPTAPTSKYNFQVGSQVYAYCWTHGLSQVRAGADEHNSRTCTNRHALHQEDATFDNRMRGCNPCLTKYRDRRANTGEPEGNQS